MRAVLEPKRLGEDVWTSERNGVLDVRPQGWGKSSPKGQKKKDREIILIHWSTGY